MCRILAYLGEPIPVENLLFDTDNSLVRQSYGPRMMNTFLNLAGFGIKAWDPISLRPEDPFTYRATSLVRAAHLRLVELVGGPEYSMLTAELIPGGIEFETRDLDV